MTGSVGALVMVISGLLGILAMFVLGPILLVTALVGYSMHKVWAKKVLIAAVLVIVVPLGVSTATYVGRSLVSSIEDPVAQASLSHTMQHQTSGNKRSGGPSQQDSLDELERMIQARSQSLPTKPRN